jgi:hypothetical protein
LAKLATKIDTQRQKIEDFNKAMVTLVLNAVAAGKTVADYVKDSKAGKGDAASLLTTGKAVGAIKGDVKGVDVASEALKLMGKPMDAVASALSSKGITMGSGDIIINGKKADVSASVDASGKPLKAISFAINEKSKTVGTGNLTAAGIDTGQIRKGLEFLDKDGKKWKLTGGSYYNNWDVVRAGYGTNKLDPNKPTIVGDRGPELAFGNMVIPNMAKVPFAPRFDVKQAANVLGPVQQGNQAGVINLTQNIYPSEGMNTDAFVRQVVSMTKQAIGQDSKLNAKMVGNPMNVSIKT